MPKKKTPDDLGQLKAERVATRAAQGTVSGAEMQARADAKLRNLPVFQLRPHRLQPTDRHADENVGDLVESIRSLGLQEPPLVRRYARGRYEILAGHRRVRAWQLLAAQGVVTNKIRVFELTGLADGEDIAIIAAEYAHRQDFSPLHVARVVGEAIEHRRKEIGRVPTAREMADLVPWGKSQLQKYHTVYDALQDSRLAPLVHRVDKPRISLLYTILRHGEFSVVRMALEAYGSEGPAAARVVLADSGDGRNRRRNGGRPKQAMVRKDYDSGAFDLILRVRPTMSVEEARLALAELACAREALAVLADSSTDDIGAQ